MDLTPLDPESFTSRPPSSSQSKSSFHNVFTHNFFRAQLSIGDWIIIGCLLQAVVVAISPLPLLYTLSPALAFLLYRVGDVVLMCWEWKENPHRRGLFMEKISAVFPGKNGFWHREKGSSVGGGKVCIILLSSRCNHPLGAFYPPFSRMTDLGGAMFRALHLDASKYGYLGSSTYQNINERIRSPEAMSVIYFRSLEDLHHFAHDEVHMKGVKWWSGLKEKERKNIAIAHEVFLAPEGGWETAYENWGRSGFAGTSHEIEKANGEKQWVCPVVKFNKGTRTAAQRMSNV